MLGPTSLDMLVQSTSGLPMLKLSMIFGSAEPEPYVALHQGKHHQLRVTWCSRMPSFSYEMPFSRVNYQTLSSVGTRGDWSCASRCWHSAFTGTAVPSMLMKCSISSTISSMSGQSQYGEPLSLIKLQSVSDDAPSDIVLNNWLVNPTGRPNCWVEVDLMQEHMNFWIKVS